MKSIGILTAGGDSPGLNAAIRAVGRGVIADGCHLLGFRDGFEGLAFDRSVELDARTLSGILTLGGTMLRTSRNKPNKMPVGKNFIDMTEACVDNYRKHHLECLVCIGGGGTHKSAMLLKKAGLNIVTLPKTIDNDLGGTDCTIGYASALEVATKAIDSLHSTASSHKRVMLLQIMGHRAGHLALGSGIAGGADVVLIPEIPFRVEKVASALLARSREGKLFSIVPVAEGAMTVAEAEYVAGLNARKENAKTKKARELAKSEMEAFFADNTMRLFELAKEIESATGLETRVTILGHLQRGGSPSCQDRILATRLGCECAAAIAEGDFGKMIALRNGGIVRVPLEDVVGIRKKVDPAGELMNVARKMGIQFGD